MDRMNSIQNILNTCGLPRVRNQQRSFNVKYTYIHATGIVKTKMEGPSDAKVVQ